jgi:hypothetical protein
MAYDNSAPFSFKENGIYYFERRVPRDLRKYYSASRFPHSLRRRSSVAIASRATRIALSDAKGRVCRHRTRGRFGSMTERRTYDLDCSKTAQSYVESGAAPATAGSVRECRRMQSSTLVEWARSRILHLAPRFPSAVAVFWASGSERYSRIPGNGRSEGAGRGSRSQ